MPTLRRLERVFRCYIVCETMEDYKEGCLMVWANKCLLVTLLLCYTLRVLVTSYQLSWLYTRSTKKNIVANRIAHFNPSGFRNFPGYTIMSKAILWFICKVQQNAKSNLRAARSKEVCFISKGFSNWKEVLARFKEHQVSECHKIAIDYETNLSRTCGSVWGMSSDAAKKTMESNVHVYASSKSLNVCSILPGKDRLCRVIPMMNRTLFSYLN